MIAIEFVSLICLAGAVGLLWLAWPSGGKKAAFLKKERNEVLYALVTVFLLAGGVGGIILGFTG